MERSTSPTSTLLLHLFPLLLYFSSSINASLLVKAPWGALQGMEVEGDGGRRMNAYLGIPYALPPVGELRFEKPRAHPGPGEGEVFVADQIMAACPQVRYLISADREMSEDCLKLDVYTPTQSQDGQPLAVMIFIHGGGFTVGDAHSYRPSRLVVDGQVIVVIIQYRLGVLGFLSTGDDRLPGNMGLWDQTLAFRWVKDNIQAFGGDQGRVTIFGQSAGSMSVGLQMFSPASRGLFQRGILQSGAPQFTSFSEDFDLPSIFKGLADVFECPGDTTEDRLKCLKEQPLDVLSNKSSEYAAQSPAQSYYFPIVDGEFLPKSVLELVQDEDYMKENGINDIDVIIGFNDKEGALVLTSTVLMNVTEETLLTSVFFNTMLDVCLFLRKLNNSDIIKKTVEFYYRGADAGVNVSESVDPLVDMYSDCMLDADIVDLARHLAASSHSAARYVYVFDHDFVFNRQGKAPGSHHGDELVLEFDNSMGNVYFELLNKSQMAPEEEPLSEKFVQILTSFAKTGNPNPPLQQDLGEGGWPQFTLEDESYLSLSLSPRVVAKVGPYRDRLSLWLSLVPQLNELVLSQKPAEGPAKDQAEAKQEQAETKEEL